MTTIIRNEQAPDTEAVTQITKAAFQNAPYSSHTEQFIVAALRKAGQLTVSLVAVKNNELVGHVAVSPVALSSGTGGWHGLGPISVRPDCQGQGIGSLLMHAAITRLRELGGAGCVLLGDPGYYERFGFKPHPGLVLPGVPAEYFLALPFGNEVPAAQVNYHKAFDATE